MTPEKLKQLVLDEAKLMASRKKPKNGEEVLDQFLDAMMNIIAPYLEDNITGFKHIGSNIK